MDLATMQSMLWQLALNPFSYETWTLLSMFMPFVLFLELPVYLFEIVGILIYWAREDKEIALAYQPRVSCIITCYAEGEVAKGTVRCLAEQLYPGEMEIIAVVDGAAANKNTLAAVREMQSMVHSIPNRRLVVAPKWQRGGRVSTLNTGLAMATGEIAMALDADTSFDNDMVAKAVRYFRDPDVAGVSGALRVRNAQVSLATRLQALEYMLAIHAGKTGLSTFNVVNNISGAFGIFRVSMLRHVGGWDTGTAEDLDLTLRIKAYMGRHPNMRIVFAPDAVGHTDAPETFRDFCRQRLRWDGDLLYLYLRKHWHVFQRNLMGLPNWIMQAWTGLMFQVFAPLLIVLYTALLMFTSTTEQICAVMGVLYVFYLLVSLCIYVPFLVFVSERKLEDLKMAPWLLLFPLFTFFSRCVSAFASVWEVVGKGHLDSSMAPWWVLKKSKF